MASAAEASRRRDENLPAVASARCLQVRALERLHAAVLLLVLGGLLVDDVDDVVDRDDAAHPVLGVDHGQRQQVVLRDEARHRLLVGLLVHDDQGRARAGPDRARRRSRSSRARCGPAGADRRSPRPPSSRGAPGRSAGSSGRRRHPRRRRAGRGPRGASARRAGRAGPRAGPGAPPGRRPPGRRARAGAATRRASRIPLTIRAWSSGASVAKNAPAAAAVRWRNASTRSAGASAGQASRTSPMGTRARGAGFYRRKIRAERMAFISGPAWSWLWKLV